MLIGRKARILCQGCAHLTPIYKNPHLSLANLLVPRIRFPYTKKRYLQRRSEHGCGTKGRQHAGWTYGNGNMSNVKNARREVAHWYPNFLYTAAFR